MTAYKRRDYEMDVEDFLTHSGSAGGGTFLSNWKEQGKIDVWLHPEARPAKLWAHRWYTIGKDRKNGDPVLRPMRFRSMEAETVLKRRHFRDRDGNLDYPPVLCPFSKLLEWVHLAIEDGTLNWVDEIFVFDETSETLVIHAGGFTGAFKKKDVTDEEKRELRKAGINLKEAWKENGHVQLQYVFRVVKAAAPEDGCLIALESQALGDKMKRVISDRIDDCSGRRPPAPEMGDPFKNPYAFRWVYDDAAEFSHRYEARAMTSLELLPEIQDVFDQEPPSIDELMAPGSVASLRNSFEEHWAIKDVTPPWDEIFEAAEAEEAKRKAEDRDAGDAPEVGRASARDEDPPRRGRRAAEQEDPPRRGRRAAEQEDEEDPPAKGARRGKAADAEDPPAKGARRGKADDAEDPPAKGARRGKAAPPPEPEEEVFGCDVCDAAMKASELVCSACGTTYDRAGQIVKRGKAPKGRTQEPGEGDDDFPTE